MKGIVLLQHKSIVDVYGKYDVQVYSKEEWHAGGK